MEHVQGLGVLGGLLLVSLVLMRRTKLSGVDVSKQTDTPLRRPKVAFGTMLFGKQVPVETAKRQINAIMEFSEESGYKAILDTARLYQKGETEKVIGQILAQRPELRNRVEIHTKADPNITPLSKDGVRKQLETSLQALGVEYVDVLYLHMPDIGVPIEETMQVCHELVREGKVREIGLSNYPAWMVVVIDSMCKDRGWHKPSLYQGVYHLFTRSIEYELIPTLRYLGIRLHVFSPLCGGKQITQAMVSIPKPSQLTSRTLRPGDWEISGHQRG